MAQRWEKLLFMHWRVESGLIRPLVPEPLEIDTYDGHAWISVTPFTLTGLRPRGLPPIPFLSSFYELNVRTYVHCQGVPGVWFFSLYASKIAPVIGARLMFALPYRQAKMLMRGSGRRLHYFLKRTGAHSAEFEANWEIGHELPSPAVDSLEFFATERYCLYAAQDQRLFRCRVYHVPWQLRSAHLIFYRSNLISAEGLPEPSGDPVVHFGGTQQVEVWPLEEITE